MWASGVHDTHEKAVKIVFVGLLLLSLAFYVAAVVYWNTFVDGFFAHLTLQALNAAPTDVYKVSIALTSLPFALSVLFLVYTIVLGARLYSYKQSSQKVSAIQIISIIVAAVAIVITVTVQWAFFVAWAVKGQLNLVTSYICTILLPYVIPSFAILFLTLFAALMTENVGVDVQAEPPLLQNDGGTRYDDL